MFIICSNNSNYHLLLYTVKDRLKPIIVYLNLIKAWQHFYKVNNLYLTKQETKIYNVCWSNIKSQSDS